MPQPSFAINGANISASIVISCPYMKSKMLSNTSWQRFGNRLSDSP
jgi:hypothetical protein